MKYCVFFAFAFLGSAFAECDISSFDTALRSTEIQLKKIESARTCDDIALSTIESISLKLRNTLRLYLLEQGWRKAIDQPKAKEQALTIIRLALTTNDDEVIRNLFFTFDIRVESPNLDDLTYRRDEKYYEKFEPERFVPAAVGIIRTYNPKRIRNLMCHMISDGTYDRLPWKDSIIFLRVWKVTDEVLKDGAKQIDACIEKLEFMDLMTYQHIHIEHFKNFKLNLEK